MFYHTTSFLYQTKKIPIIHGMYCKVGLRSHKITQIIEYKHLEDDDSEYDVRSCPNKDHNQIAFFYVDTG